MVSRGKKLGTPVSRINRVAARRVFHRAKDGKPVVLTIGVPHQAPRRDWACAVRVTGLDPWLSRSRLIFGVDGVQALQLAIQFASATLESCGHRLQWLGQTADLGFTRL